MAASHESPLSICPANFTEVKPSSEHPWRCFGRHMKFPEHSPSAHGPNLPCGTHIVLSLSHSSSVFILLLKPRSTRVFSLFFIYFRFAGRIRSFLFCSVSH